MYRKLFPNGGRRCSRKCQQLAEMCRKWLPKRPKLSLKSDKNGVKIDAEIDVGKKVAKMEAPVNRIGPHFRPKSLNKYIRNSTKKRYQKSIENRCQKVE